MEDLLLQDLEQLIQVAGVLELQLLKIVVLVVLAVKEL